MFSRVSNMSTASVGMAPDLLQRKLVVECTPAGDGIVGDVLKIPYISRLACLLVDMGNWAKLYYRDDVAAFLRVVFDQLPIRQVEHEPCR